MGVVQLAKQAHRIAQVVGDDEQHIQSRHRCDGLGILQRSILCVGKNYSEHARELLPSGFETGASKSKPVDDCHAIFAKPASSVVGQDAVVDLRPTVMDAVDHKAELGVIIGKPGRNTAEGDAMGHVWGYTIINDVTADEVDGTALDIACHVNRELRQRQHARSYLYHPAVDRHPVGMSGAANGRCDFNRHACWGRHLL